LDGDVVTKGRRPAEAALFDGARLALDGHTALEERVSEFEGIVLRGELPSDVTLPEDDAGAAAAVAEQYALYAARLFRAVAPPDDANARRFAAATEEHTLAALDVHHDPRRLDWSLRELPRIAKNLRGAISALPASWEGKIVVEAAGAALHTMPVIESALAPGATIVYLGRTGERAPVMLDVLVSKAARIVGARGHAGYGIFPHIIDLIASGALDLKPMITATAPLKDYAQAFEQSKTREDGKILLTQR